MSDKDYVELNKLLDKEILTPKETQRKNHLLDQAEEAIQAESYRVWCNSQPI